jgi:hypothetical protein
VKICIRDSISKDFIKTTGSKTDGKTERYLTTVISVVENRIKMHLKNKGWRVRI